MHYNPGDIVYIVEPRAGDWKLTTQICEVEDQYGSVVALNFIHGKDSRIINGIPIDEFEETKPKKLPKDWMKNMNTRDLYEETYDEALRDKLSEIHVRDKAAIRKGLDEGVLVSDKPSLSVQTSISKDGYTVRTEHLHHERTSGMYNWSQIYDDFDSAKKYIHDYYAELERQSNLTDEEWSKEQIEHELSRYAGLYHLQPAEEQRIRDIIYSLDNIEDVEVRIFNGNFQWKYWKKKRWNTVWGNG